ncbi:recombinase RecT [Paraburkholderia unamae]|uniref:Recombination protein RecT n=1 Tax=Paraburkholderia unamae TaxID=219649 RepID=A0ABX5KFP7_9BURK|nr:recombinase RecT [Paraburkholderia unamae]PVX77207.1 recombination protein RecT [Paraburkholderia unamae]
MSSAALKAVATDRKEQNPVVAFRNFLEKQKAQLAAALPKHMSPDRMIRLACTEFAKNPTLQKCDAISVFGSIIQASQLGLEIGVLGQAYLVPYRNNKKNTMEAQFIPGYKGLIALARRSGEVTSIETNIVYEHDTFKLTLGVDSNLVHEPYLDGDRGKARLVYGVAKFKDGGHHLEWMSISDVEKVRARSKASGSGPWVTDYEQMVRKTLIRRMANYLPMSIELNNALQVDEAVDAGKHATIDGDFVVVREDDESPASDHADLVTGEITDQRAQQEESMVSYGDLLAQVQKATSVEALDLMMDTARDLPEEQYVKIQQAADDRREVILGA